MNKKELEKIKEIFKNPDVFQVTLLPKKKITKAQKKLLTEYFRKKGFNI